MELVEGVTLDKNKTQSRFASLYQEWYAKKIGKRTPVEQVFWNDCKYI